MSKKRHYIVIGVVLVIAVVGGIACDFMTDTPLSQAIGMVPVSALIGIGFWYWNNKYWRKNHE